MDYIADAIAGLSLIVAVWALQYSRKANRRAENLARVPLQFVYTADRKLAVRNSGDREVVRLEWEEDGLPRGMDHLGPGAVCTVLDAFSAIFDSAVGKRWPELKCEYPIGVRWLVRPVKVDGGVRTDAKRLP